MITLRSCAVGGGHHASREFGGAYLCPKHLRMLMEGFDPQPGDCVRILSKVACGVYIVSARNGDSVSMHMLGLPAGASETFPVGSLYPAGFDHVYANKHVKGCGN